MKKNSSFLVYFREFLIMNFDKLFQIAKSILRIIPVINYIKVKEKDTYGLESDWSITKWVYATLG